MSQSRQTDNNAKVLKGTINAIISKIKKVRNIAIEKFPDIKGKDYSEKLTQISSTISTNLEILQNFLEELGTDENFELFLQSKDSNGKYFNDVLNYIFYGEKLKENLADKIEFFIPGNKKGKIIALKNGTTEYTIPYLVKNVLSAQKQDVIDEKAAKQFIQNLNNELDAAKKEKTTAKIRATRAENKNKKLQENLKAAQAQVQQAQAQAQAQQAQAQQVEAALNKKQTEIARKETIDEIFKDAERELAKARRKIESTSDSWKFKKILRRQRTENIATAMCNNIEVNLNALKEIVSNTNVELDEKAISDCIKFILHGGKDEKGVENNEYTFGYTENGETKTRKFSNISEVVIKEGKTKKGKTKEGETKQYTSTIENINKEINRANRNTNILKRSIIAGVVVLFIGAAVGISATLAYNGGKKDTTPEVGDASSPNNTSDRNTLIAQIYEMEDESEKYYTQQYGQKAKDVVDAMVGGANKVTIENVGSESGEVSRVLNESLYNPDLVINQEIIDIANDEEKGVKELSTDQIKQLVEQTLTGSDEAFADGRDIVNEVIEYVNELIEGKITADYDAVSVATMNLSNFKNASYYNCKPTAMSVWFTAEDKQGVLQYILNGEIKFDSLNTSGNINGYVSTIKHIISKEAMVGIAKAINEESKKDEPKDISTVIYNNINELLGEIKADNTYERIKVDSNGIKEIRISVNDLNKAAKNPQGGGIDVPYKVVMEDGNIYEGAFTYDNCGKVVDTGIIKNNIVENCITGYGVESEAER